MSRIGVPFPLNGTNGNTVLYGSGAPSNGLGVDGNFYIDTTAHVIYGPKAGGAWPAGTSLVGPTGATGTAGAAGADGAMGATGATGTAGPNLLSTSTTTALVGAIFANGATVFSDADITTDGYGDLSIAGQNGTAQTTPSLLVTDSYGNSVAIGDGGGTSAAISVASGSTWLDGGLISTDGAGSMSLAGSISLAGSLGIGSTAIETVINGTSGNITWSQPIQAPDANCFSVVAIKLYSYKNAATETISFMVPFTHAPVAVVNSASLAITLNDLTITIPVCTSSTNATILLIGI